MKKVEIITIDYTSIKSIEKAEKKKTALENKGYKMYPITADKLSYILEK